MAKPSNIRDLEHVKFVDSPTRQDGSAIEVFATINEPDVGQTRIYSGSVGVTPQFLPQSVFRPIDEIIIKCPYQTPSSRRLEISIDGATWFTLAVGEWISFSPKKDTSGNRILQIVIRGNTSSVLYEAIINYLP